MRQKMLFAVLAASMMLTIESAFGQSTTRASIPFDFSICNSELPAARSIVTGIVLAVCFLLLFAFGEPLASDADLRVFGDNRNKNQR